MSTYKFCGGKCPPGSTAYDRFSGMEYHIRSNFRMTKFMKTIRWPVLQKDIFENWWKSL